MPICMIIALDIFIIIHFSINCSTVICSPTVLFSFMREACSETYGPRVYFTSYKFLIYNSSFLFILFCNLYFPIYITKIPKIFILLSLSDLTFASGREGIVSDVGFRQTLKVRTLGCVQSLSLLPIYALAR